MLDGGDPKLRAVKLLSSLKDAAWTQAQSVLDPVDLHSNDGMLIFKSFIRTTFGKYEILDQTEILDEFLDKCRRRGDEQHRGYANKFSTLTRRCFNASSESMSASQTRWPLTCTGGGAPS